MRATRALLAAAFALTPVAARPQQPPPDPQPPVFRSGVDLVTVDAAVLDDQGRPVEGLTAADFDVQVDGRPRAVVSAQFVPLANRSSAEDPRPAHYSTNEHEAAGRLILFVVDEEHIRPGGGQAALRAAARFIDLLQPHDRIAATAIPRVGSTLDFTTDHRAVRSALHTLVGRSAPMPAYYQIGLSEALEISEGSRQHLEVAVKRECGTSLTRTESPARMAESAEGRDPCPVQLEQEARAMAQHARGQAARSLGALGSLVGSLRGLEGPKTIILLSEGLVAEPRLVDFSRLAAAAAAARVTIHVLHLDTPVVADATQERLSPTILKDRYLREDALTRLAGAARGGVFPFIGDGSMAFGRIARELSGYYLVGFEATDADRDGFTHAIQLKVRRRGALVRARQAFSGAPRSGPPAVAQQLADLLRSPRPATELPLRVSTYTYQEPGTGKLRVVVSAEAATGGGTASAPTLAFVLLDVKNVIAASATHVAADGRHAFSTVVAAGDYTLKVAGVDALGRRGAVERGFTARVTDVGAIQVSDFMVAEAPSAASDPLQPAIEAIAERELVGYLELYAAEATPLRQATVRMEVSSSESGPSVVTIPALLHRRDPRWSIARAQLPTASLPPGRYFVRAQVFVAGEPVKRLVRPISVGRPSSQARR